MTHGAQPIIVSLSMTFDNFKMFSITQHSFIDYPLVTLLRIPQQGLIYVLHLQQDIEHNLARALFI